ncbi:hypothetical protein HPB48_016944 [Haemaphysalis longicornis]|uniref:Ig-like domain-containing protein n=1 Tax=Haemaphysalis longicornis TaxID=44386 RepID=A0A9J6G1N4_HAELO|nr:hypothetical protein HPB48_016944 [Haemaphysalis longicornis]
MLDTAQLPPQLQVPLEQQNQMMFKISESNGLILPVNATAPFRMRRSVVFDIVRIGRTTDFFSFGGHHYRLFAHARRVSSKKVQRMDAGVVSLHLERFTRQLGPFFHLWKMRPAPRSASGVQIVRLSVPTWVENGTEDSVLLDCEYVYTERDDSQLVVKWFLNDDPKPIYQWIPELESRHVSQRLKGRLNTDFTVTGNHFTKFRALNLLRPTTELSGRYSCHVTSHSSQDQRSQLMTVYARPKHFVFNFSRSAEESATTFVCEATGAFPLPTLTVFRLDEEPSSPSSAPRRHALAPTQRVTPRQDGSYVTRVTSRVPDEDFSRAGRHLFVCLLSIPGTDFKKQRLIEFYPGRAFPSRIFPPVRINTWLIGELGRKFSPDADSEEILIWPTEEMMVAMGCSAGEGKGMKRSRYNGVQPP